jgi:agmatinase
VFDPDQPLQLSRRLVGTALPDGSLGTLQATLGTRFALDEAAWTILEQFRTPRPARGLVVSGKAPAALQDLLVTFVAGGLLVPPPEGEHLHAVGGVPEEPASFRPAAPAFLCPSPAGVTPVDVCVVGVPLDRTAYVRGAAAAPAALRRVANGLADLDPRTGRMRGMRDGADGRLLLAGMCLEDHGDVVLHEEESVDRSYGRIRDAVRTLRARTDALPVFLGGDHSITTPILEGLLTEPTVIVHFDAHADLDQAFRRAPHHHGSFMDLVWRHPLVAAVVQVGLRAFQPAWAEAPPRVTQIGARRARTLDPAALVALLPADRPCYVTIDIDAIDPADAPGTGTPVPCGVPAWKLEELVEAVGEARDVCGIDLVEIAPHLDRGDLTTSTGLRLLFRLLDAVHRRRGRAAAAPYEPPSSPSASPLIT